MKVAVVVASPAACAVNALAGESTAGVAAADQLLQIGCLDVTKVPYAADPTGLDSRDIRVYCMCGNVRQLGDRPMREVVNSERILVSQLKAFFPGDFSHLVETRRQETSAVPSAKTVALFVRETEGDAAER